MTLFKKMGRWKTGGALLTFDKPEKRYFGSKSTFGKYLETLPCPYRSLLALICEKSKEKRLGRKHSIGEKGEGCS